MERDQEKYTPLINEIIWEFLGKGKKVNEATPAQAEMVKCIVDKIEDTLL